MQILYDILDKLYENLTRHILFIIHKLPDYITSFIIFIVIISLSYLAARIIKFITKLTLKLLDLDNQLDKFGLGGIFFGYKPSYIIEKSVFYSFFIYFILNGLILVGFLNNSVLDYFFKYLYAILVFVSGIVISGIVHKIIYNSNTGEKEAIANTIRALIIYIFFVFSVEKAGFETTILYKFLEYTIIAFSIFLGLIMAMIFVNKYGNKLLEIIKK